MTHPVKLKAKPHGMKKNNESNLLLSKLISVGLRPLGTVELLLSEWIGRGTLKEISM